VTFRLTAVSAVVLLLAACNPKPQHAALETPTPNPSATSTTPPVNVTSLGGTPKHPLVFSVQRNNRVKYRLTALEGKGRFVAARTQATFNTAHVTFYDRSGKTLSAKSPTAFLDQGNPQKTITMVGGVEATSGGQVLRCRELVYRQADETLHGTGDVVVTGPKGMRLTGSHFDSDLTLTNIEMR
jgi:hypothetical protein